MDLATLVGLLGGFGVIIGAMVLGGGVGMFINVPSLIIVIGGTMMTVLMQFSIGQFFGAIKVAIKAFTNKLDPPEVIIEKAVDMATEARKGGLLALEGKDTGNSFFQNGIQMLVDGHDGELVRKLLESDMKLTVDRHDIGQKIFKSIGDYAPAMGMIGTLVGLVQMLSNMSDPASIGPAMAVALLTTLYGAMIANMIALPISDKLGLRSAEEKMVKSMIIDGLSGIQEGRNPRVIEDLLKTYLPDSKRVAGGDAKEAA